MLAMGCHSHAEHPLRSVSTNHLAEMLAEEMVDNEFDGKMSRPKDNKRKRGPEHLPKEPTAAGTHVLKALGAYASGMPVQLLFVMCGMKTSAFCTGEECKRVALCHNAKKPCLAA